MRSRSTRWATILLAAVFSVAAVACSDDDDGATDDPDTTEVAPTTEADDTEAPDNDDGETDDTEAPDADEAEGDAIKAFDEIDVCGLVAGPDIESVVGDEQVEPMPETSPVLPAPNLSSDAEVVDAAGCLILSSEVTDAGFIVRLFRFESADDAAATVETLLNGEELEDTQADVAYLNRIDMPEGFAYILAGSVDDVLIVAQAQSTPDQADPATQVATLNSIISALERA